MSDTRLLPELRPQPVQQPAPPIARRRLRLRLSVAWETLLAALLIALASAVRLGLARAGWPGTDSDDSTMGLMAIHILRDGAHPIFFWGQAYMGSIEAYAGALMFAVLGVSVFALKCGLVLLYALFLLALYSLLAQIFDRRLALVGLALAAFGNDQLLYHELEAYGGYLETVLFGALMTSLAVWLVRTGHEARRSTVRAAGFAGWGLSAGLGLYSDPLVLPFVALTGGALLLWCRRDLWGWYGALAAGALLGGLAPWLIYVATAHTVTAAASFVPHAATSSHAAVPQAPGSASPANPVVAALQAAGTQLLGAMVISLPNMTGATVLCPLPADALWPVAHWSAPGVARCIALRGVWGAGIAAAMVAAICIETQQAIRCWRQRTVLTAANRQQASRTLGRLLALAAPMGTLVLYSAASASGGAPVQYARYLLSMLIAMPVLLCLLVERALPPRGASAPLSLPLRAHGRRAGGVGPRLAAAALAFVLLATFLAGTLATFGEVRPAAAQDVAQTDLVTTLERAGDTRIYSEFWTCYRTSFESGERVVCSVLNNDLSLRPSRYAPYDQMVGAAAHPAFVFPLAGGWAATFRQLAAQRDWRYTTTRVDGQFVIFRITSGFVGGSAS